MKKILLFALAFAAALTMASCGKTSTDAPSAGGQDAASPTPAAETAAPASTALPMTPETGTLTIGDYTLTAEYVPFDEPLIVSNLNDPDMDVLGNTIYVADGDKAVYVYTIDGAKLSFVKKLDIENDDGIAVDKDGKIYAEGGVFEAEVYDADGTGIGKAAADGEITTSKTEDFALTYFPGDDAVTKISGGAAEDWTLTGMAAVPSEAIFSMISAIEIQGDHVLVGGESADSYLVAVYSTSGEQIAVSDGTLSSSMPNAMAETANGYICTTVGDVNLITKEGSVIGKAEDTEELFGVKDSLVWIYEAAPLDDGSVLMLASVSPEESDSAQLMLYKVSGF